jgi:hypothetical protein
LRRARRLIPRRSQRDRHRNSSFRFSKKLIAFRFVSQLRPRPTQWLAH